MKLLAALCLLAAPAAAEPLKCYPRDALAKGLTADYGESGRFQGLATDGQAMWEIFGKQDGTWTLFVVRPDGLACAIASGQMWIGFGVPQGEAG